MSFPVLVYPALTLFVFDWAYTPVFLPSLSTWTQWIYDEMSPEHSAKRLQFVLFSEALVPDYMTHWLQARKLDPKSRGYLGEMSYDLGRMKKHMFANVEVDLSNLEKGVELKVNEVVGLVDKLRKPGKPGRIIIFVTSKREFKCLTRELGDRPKIYKLRKGMTLKKKKSFDRQIHR